MMKGFSSIAPYLTAYHKGLIFGKPEFAFAADDDVLYMGEPSPGFYMPRRNSYLAPASNEHVFEIHNQINDLLAKLAGITMEREYDIKNLREHYKNNPVYIALVGGATVLPQYLYETSIEPVLPPEDVQYYWGAGVPSDFIYGNIDPKPGEWSGQVPDLYSESPNYYPYQENILRYFQLLIAFLELRLFFPQLVLYLTLFLSVFLQLPLFFSTFHSMLRPVHLLFAEQHVYQFHV